MSCARPCKNGKRDSGLATFANVQPNPFNPKTTLSFRLEQDDDVTLRVVAVRGRLVRTLKSSRLSRGDHTITWDGRDDGGANLPAGVYPARLETGAFTTVQKMALLK